MKKNEFCNRLYKAVQERLQGSCKVELKEIRKNNGVKMQALLIAAEGEYVIPTIYLEQFYNAYEEGMLFGEIVDDVIGIYDNGKPKRAVNMDFYSDYNAVKNRICYRLIQRKGNEDLLKEIPYVEFLDLAICFFYAYQDDNLGEGSILVYNSHSERWKCTAQDLLQLAIDNTQKIFPEKTLTIRDLVEEAGITEEVFDNEPCQDEGFFMTVLTNEKKNHGAVSILYPEVLESFSRHFGESFYIIPSSVHEVIIMKRNILIDTEEVKRTIYEVNRSQLSPDEVLSDNLYYYDKREKTVSIV